MVSSAWGITSTSLSNMRSIISHPTDTNFAHDRTVTHRALTAPDEIVMGSISANSGVLIKSTGDGCVREGTHRLAGVSEPTGLILRCGDNDSCGPVVIVLTCRGGAAVGGGRWNWR